MKTEDIENPQLPLKQRMKQLRTGTETATGDSKPDDPSTYHNPGSSPEKQAIKSKILGIAPPQRPRIGPDHQADIPPLQRH